MRITQASLVLGVLLCLAISVSAFSSGPLVSSRQLLSQSAGCHDLLKECPAWAQQGLCQQAFDWHDKPVAEHWCRSSCRACSSAGAAAADAGKSRSQASQASPGGSSDTIVVAGREYQLLPDSPEALQGTRSGSAGSSSLPPAAASFYQWHADMQLLADGAMDKLLDKLAELPLVKQALKAAGLSLEQLKALGPQLMMYWQRKVPEIMEVYRAIMSSEVPDLKDLLASSKQLAQAFDLEAMEEALMPANSSSCGAPSSSATRGSAEALIDAEKAAFVSRRLHLDLEAIAQAESDFLAHGWASGSNGSSSGGSTTSRGRSSRQAGSGSSRKAAGPNLLIPIVFHVLSHALEDPASDRPLALPQNAAGTRAIGAAERWVQVLNDAFSRMAVGMHFALDEVRVASEEHPHLLLDSVERYQTCLADQECFGELRSKHSKDVKSAINVWVFGYVSHLPDDSWPQCVGKCNDDSECSGCPYGQAILPNGDESAEHYVYMSYDTFDPDNMNNAARMDAGANIFVHELGHYLGLRHTHGDGDGSSCTGDDLIVDTPVDKNLMLNTPLWNALHEQVCVPMRKGQLSVEQAQALAVELGADSCPQHTGVDNVFNFMAYSPAECMARLTLGQIQHMWAEVKLNRPMLFAASTVAE